MMRPASMQPLVRCAQRSMPAQHCFCCCWGGQNSRAGGWAVVGWSHHSTLRGLHASLLPASHSRHPSRVSDAQEQPRLDRGLAAQWWS